MSKNPVTVRIKRFDNNIRATFRELSLALMEWQEPPFAPWERPTVYRCWDPQGEIEPFDVQRDWEERA